MAEEMTTQQGEVAEATAPKKSKKSEESKGPNFFVKIWKKIKKLCTDTFNEMKKVVWTPKAELKKSTVLIVVTVVCVAAAIAIVDSVCSFVINGIAGLFPVL